MRTTEEWRSIEGYEGLYSVSSFGRVRSKWKNTTLLQPVRRANGYFHVQLCKGDGTRKQASIHALVAAAFLGPRPLKHDVSHVDGDKANNSVANLRYESHSENCVRRRAHGTERIPSSARLSEDQVRAIRAMRECGALQREIAEAFGVTQAHVSRVLSRRFWPHV